MVIVAVLAVTVSPVAVAKFHEVPAVAQVTVAAPIVKVRVLELLLEKVPQVTDLPFKSNVPWVRVIVFDVPTVKVSASCILQPAPFIVKAPKAFPPEVIVWVVAEVLTIFACTAPVIVMPETKRIATFDAPAVPSPTFKVAPLTVKPPVKPVQFSERHVLVPETVTVLAPEEASKNTSSAAVGTAAPPAPPEVVAHLLPAVPSQVAVPPTQKRFAI